MMSDLAGVLAERHHLGKDQAQQFLAAIVETIRDGVADDGLVKIKGLGTFKLVDVDARESISVNSGERVVIDGHSKLTFLPDLAMKELVNRPFAQFDTVILNEGVNFDETSINDDDEEAEPETILEEPVAPVEEPVVQPDEEPVAQPVEEPVVQPVEEAPVAQVVQEPEPVAPVEEPKEKPAKKPAEVPAWGYVEESQEESDEDYVDEGESSRWWLWLLLAIVACAASFAGGYLLGRSSSNNASVDATTSVPVMPTDTIVAPAPADTLAKDTTTVDTVKQAPAPAADEEWKKYDAMDNRVRLGAYRIVGTDQVVKARKGDTTKRIARRTLGEGMECYIEVYNGISGRDTLKAGQEVKLPKLVSKKKFSSKK
ncbi:MAG: HU family DNA-binding protein [Prevotella sp.]|nr:HU family DNA-binding protein [Prevotella sp.]